MQEATVVVRFCQRCSRLSKKESSRLRVEGGSIVFNSASGQKVRPTLIGIIWNFELPPPMFEK
jgi:hypothetical protein